MTSRRAAKGPARRITLPENGEALLSDLQRALEQNDVRSAIAAWQRILEAAHIDLGARAIAMATVIAARVDPATGVRAFDRPEQQDLWQSIQTQLTPPIRWPREPHLPAARGRPRSIDPYKEHLRNMQAAVWLHVHLLSLPKRGVRARSEREGAELSVGRVGIEHAAVPARLEALGDDDVDAGVGHLFADQQCRCQPLKCADAHPAEVKAFLFVDSSHEEQFLRLHEADPTGPTGAALGHVETQRTVVVQGERRIVGTGADGRVSVELTDMAGHPVEPIGPIGLFRLLRLAG